MAPGEGGWQGREATGTQRNVVREAGEEPGQPGVTAPEEGVSGGSTVLGLTV